MAPAAKVRVTGACIGRGRKPADAQALATRDADACRPQMEAILAAVRPELAAEADTPACAPPRVPPPEPPPDEPWPPVTPEVKLRSALRAADRSSEREALLLNAVCATATGAARASPATSNHRDLCIVSRNNLT
jgi:hypothetical protein